MRGITHDRAFSGAHVPRTRSDGRFLGVVWVFSAQRLALGNFHIRRIPPAAQFRLRSNTMARISRDVASFYEPADRIPGISVASPHDGPVGADFLVSH